MAARPLWSGQSRPSLVSMAVDLYSATQSGARKQKSKKKTAKSSPRKSGSRKRKRA